MLGKSVAVLDTATIINLYNGETLFAVSKLIEIQFCVGPIVLTECSRDLVRELYKFEVPFYDGAVTIAEFQKVSERFNLGSGESECLCIALKESCKVATDDKKARYCANQFLGEESVIGSIGILQFAKNQAILTPQECYKSYKKMKLRGGFLPNIEEGYFHNGIGI